MYTVCFRLNENMSYNLISLAYKGCCNVFLRAEVAYNSSVTPGEGLSFFQLSSVIYVFLRIYDIREI
ncbi:hypothetical protein Anas_10097 [Armadillidium nasatum]|uniref:Uncharacterized protein n=1 Tax=Armadillidium nasatum TaxID=96803 RepID=A0A5N5TH18_9CRUS|nr:hypothetical protein Anas_10097 [Armadillidium nasatum]